MIVDTSVLLAFFDRDDYHHEVVKHLIEQSRGPLVLSPLVLAEYDYLVMTRHGVEAERAVLATLLEGPWRLAEFDLNLLKRSVDLIELYADHAIGLADASLLVLAEKYRTRQIATLDRRHFSFLRFGDGTAPEIVP